MLLARDTYYPPVAVTDSSAYSNYPMGTWAGDPCAPWNQPDDDYDEYGDWDEESEESDDGEEPREPGRLRELYEKLVRRCSR